MKLSPSERKVIKYALLKQKKKRPNKQLQAYFLKLGKQLFPRIASAKSDKGKAHVLSKLDYYMELAVTKIYKRIPDKLARKLCRKFPKYCKEIDDFRKAIALEILLLTVVAILYYPADISKSNELRIIEILLVSILEEVFSLFAVQHNFWIQYQIVFNLLEYSGYVAVYHKDASLESIYLIRLKAVVWHLLNALAYRAVKNHKQLSRILLIINAVRHVVHNLKGFGYI